MLIPLTCVAATAALALSPQEGVLPGLEAWPPAKQAAQLALEERLLAGIEPASLAEWHEKIAGVPHDAGTPGDELVVETLARRFEELGLEVETQELHVLLPRPVRAELEVVEPERVSLPLKERRLEEDPYTAGEHWEDITIGWNAYSASGEATAGVVYANFGRKEDFETLGELGVDCTGKIVIARYGGNYRGYKEKYAREAGAVGLVIFTDPKDSGYGRGIPYPEGGYANETSIQRGSILAMAYVGDPTTPFRESTRDAARLPLEELELPRIPVQPVGWAAAEEILGRMRGESAPGDWQGGLPLRYRLTGGDALRVRILVQQELALRKTHNVLGTLRGSEEPEKEILIGAHHDAWGFGAADSQCGTIAVLEAAKAWSLAAKAGYRPRRSITFAGWGAEEYGIIGSVEYVESRIEAIRENAVCYLNLDMAATGTRFYASSSPTLREAIVAALGRVPQPGDEEGRSVGEVWSGRFGDMGGGSDHVGFIALGGVPCASLGGGGSKGTSYHSAYDTLHWYRQVVGDDYAAARMVAQAAALVSARYAAAPVLPIDPARVGTETHRHLELLTERGRERGFFEPGPSPVAGELRAIEVAARAFGERATEVRAALQAACQKDALGAEALAAINRELQALDRCWLHEEGIPERPWFQNLYAASDETSGYAPWILPALRYAVDHRDREALREAVPRYLAVFARSSAALEALAGTLSRVESAEAGAPR